MSSRPAVTYLWTFGHDDGDLSGTLEEYLGALARIPHTKELIIVDDGVGEVGRQALLAKLQGTPFPAALLHLHRGGGEAAALSSGFRQAAGEVIVVLPSYRQVDGAEIGRITDAIRTGGLDYIASWRQARIDSRLGQALSQWFNALTARMTGVHLHDINSGLRAMKRKVVEEVSVHGDLFRFLPVLAAMQGFRVGELPVAHVAERVRRGDYRPGIFIRRFLDLLSLFFLAKFTRKPLRFFGLLGTGVFAIGAAILLYLAVDRLLGIPLADRPLLVLGVLMFVFGAQLFSIGLLGELIIFHYSGEIPEYKVESIYDSSRAER